MLGPVLIFLALSCTQLSAGDTNKDVAEDNNVESAARTKRETYDMIRYGRGLHMLRLGKRDDVSPIYLVDDDEDDLPGYGRFRRSLSSGEYFEDSNKSGMPLNLRHVTADNDAPSMTVFQPLKEEMLSPEDLEWLRVGKRQLPMLRLGKRNLGMLRLGKRYFDELEAKRGLGMLRLGKREISMTRLGHPSVNTLSLGENLQNANNEEEKRSLGMLRLGKRQLAMLRLGKRFDDFDQKRSLGMLRLGKRFHNLYSEEEKTDLSPEKRPMNMLRLGKREDEDKRSLGMLRLGKRSTQ